MKTLLKLICCSLLLVSGCSSKQTFKPLPTNSEVKIMIASDLHYFSPHLTDNKEAYQAIIKPRDGKEILYTDQLTDAFIQQVLEASPTALILSGDLTFNGEKKSHEDLASKLNKLEAAGIAVLVIPGNHDVRSPYARRYEEDKTYYADFIEAEDFKTIYKQAGFADAVSMDEHSLSYFTKLSDDLYILMLDTNLYENNSQMGAIAGGKVKDGSYDWIEECLQLAKKENAQVISVTHQSLLNHSDSLNDDYTINNSLFLYRLLMDYDVTLNLSGHIHVQDIEAYSLNAKTIYDIASGALAVFSNQMGMINFKPHDSIRYSRVDIDVEAWAKKTKQTDENLLNYEAYSLNHFIETSYANFLPSFNHPEISVSNQEKLARFQAKLNLNYFSATDTFKNLETDEGYLLWQKYKDLISSNYIQSMLKNNQDNQNELLIPLP